MEISGLVPTKIKKLKTYNISTNVVVKLVSCNDGDHYLVRTQNFTKN